MPIQAFPPHDFADPDGLLAVGGDLSTESLLLAYRNGIFPWPLDEALLTWFSPPERALLFLKDFHAPRSLHKARKRGGYEIRFDSDFAAVIRACRESPKRFDAKGNPQRGTWITADMVEAYIKLHLAGYAHSVECWREGVLVGGLYGVSIGRYFAGESMFYHHTDASKLALWHLIDWLSAADVGWIDCQVITPLFSSFGARAVPRDQFLALLEAAVAAPPLNFASRRRNG